MSQGYLELVLNSVEEFCCEIINKCGTSNVFILGRYNINLLKLNRKKLYLNYFTRMSFFLDIDIPSLDQRE